MGFEKTDWVQRPSWEYVNPEILGNLFEAEKTFAIWLNKMEIKRIDPSTIPEFYDWNVHVCRLFLNLKGQLEDEKYGEKFRKLNVDMTAYLRSQKKLTIEERRDYFFDLIVFVKILGISKVEGEEFQRESIMTG